MRLAPFVLVCLLATTAQAHLDNNLVRGRIRARMIDFRACYEKELVNHPKLEGRVVASFKIDRSGRVRESTATGLEGVKDCVAAVIRTIEFPPNARDDIQVTYPFEFAQRP